jgi:tRNA G18 (ribose-2'-O)-methylase SpoU
MPVIPIDSSTDARVKPYLSLKDRELAREGDLFIAEGEQVVKRLLASDFQTHSVLLSERRVTEIAPLVPPGVPVYALPDPVVTATLGFRFHSGVMAIGIRKPQRPLGDYLPRTGSVTVMVCPELNSAENLGGMIRIASGFGVDLMLLGERSVDPFWRQSVRVSMGNVFNLPIHLSDNLTRDLLSLRDEFHIDLIATVLDNTATDLRTFNRPERAAILFGSEAHGLSDEHIAISTHKITIPMKLGTDSLNVMVAAGVVMWGMEGRHG